MIFFGWELGANLGHTAAFAPIRTELELRGETVVLSLRAPTSSALQAPIAPEELHQAPPVNLPDICLRNGWRDKEALLYRVNQWRDQIIASGASLVIADHAPTLILAARTLDIPVMIHGNGFTLPPDLNPIPALRPWCSVAPDLLLRIDSEATESANFVLRQYGRPGLRSFADLFDIAEKRLITVPDLDQLPGSGRGYWGVMPPVNAGIEPVFAANAAHRVFAYIRQDHPHFAALLNGLGNLSLRPDVSVCAFVPAIGDYTAPERMKIVSDPVNLQSVIAGGVSAVLGYSPGFASAFLTAGVPALLAPTHIEQFLFAARVKKAHAGLIASPEHALTATDVERALSVIVTDCQFQKAARKIEVQNPANPLSAYVSRAIDLANTIGTKERLAA